MLFANIIGRNFKDSDYVHVGDDSGEKYVTLKRFGKLFLTAVPYVARSHWCAVLTQTRNILDRMESHETQAKPLPVVAFSISLLLDYIRFGQGWWSWNEWDVHDGLWKNRRVPRNRCLVRHQPLTDHMTGPAWCPFNNRRYDSYGTAVFFHLAKLERRTFPTKFVDHSKDCSAERCKANNTDQHNYIVRHREEALQCCQHQPGCVGPGCVCNFVSVVEGDLIRILRSGKVPLVEFTETSSGRVSVRLREMRVATEYVAISHV